MNSIGFKNFRRFADFPSIDLGDVTILVGGNNSGKSTIVKALLLCLDNLRSMTRNIKVIHDEENITPVEHKPLFKFGANQYHDVKIKTFARALRKSPKNDAPSQITFEFSFENFVLTYVVAGNKEKDLPYGEVYVLTIEDKWQHTKFTFNFDTNEVEFSILTANEKKKNDLNSQLFHDYRDTQKALTKAKHDEDLDSISALTTKLDKITAQINSIYGRDLTESEEFTQEELQALVKKSIRSEKRVIDSHSIKMEYLNEGIISTSDLLVEDLIESLLNYAHSDKLQKEQNRLDRIDEEELSPEHQAGLEEKRQILQEKKKFQEAIVENIDSIFSTRSQLSSLIDSINLYYISAHIAQQNSLYVSSNQDDYLAQTIDAFYSLKIIQGEKEYEFIRKWMKEFEIGTDFKIDSIFGDAYRVEITEPDGTSVLLADKGMGSIQLMILLFRLASIIRKEETDYFSNSFIVIEEPEQNLHPKMQSKLADLFEAVASEYNCKFIIETHSEYLIRKTQVLVAKAKYFDEEDLNEHNPFKVYYLPEDGSERYEMKFTTKGRFANKFGKGFFDTASELAFELF